ncbi:Chemotaxis protein methyltransferase CheR [Candidatus Burkholderia pumila]|uniref:histidine kinase n=1 Tax=Candidatus Burkholderia pumila TaxID=1090375 RepID=A0ABR5HLE1_9BURK|nr:Chemotaxis protein methyltransferase CheR [Candidatus Burkholderia pumila]
MEDACGSPGRIPKNLFNNPVLRRLVESALLTRRMAPEVLAIMFDLFVQEHPPGAHLDEGGLGIGLTLVRAITELHGGHVEAKSEGLGQGSTFTLWLPLAQAPEQIAAPPSRVMRMCRASNSTCSSSMTTATPPTT